MGDVLWHGEVMSKEWACVCEAMSKRIDFGINEARRDLARQTYFWNCGPNGCCCCNNCNLAARPTLWAPHIRFGRIDHAIDFSNPDAVVAELERLGLEPTRPVPGEDWHVEVNAQKLREFYRKHSVGPYDHLPRHVRRAVKAFVGARNTVRSRVRDRDKFDSHTQKKKWLAKEELVQKAVKVRSKKRARVERMLGRSRKESTRRILRKVLDT